MPSCSHPVAGSTPRSLIQYQFLVNNAVIPSREESWHSARQHVVHGSTCCWCLQELQFSYTRIAPCEINHLCLMTLYELLCVTMVQSHLDYCNALFTGISEANLSKLQRVQNMLARVVLRRGKYEHITPALSELHWLPVRQRIDFKVATLTFKVRQSGHPTYFSQQLSDYTPNRSFSPLCIPTSSSDPTYKNGSGLLAQRGFTSAAPKIWNSLIGRSPKLLYSWNFQTQT